MTNETSDDEDAGMLTVTEACDELRVSKWTLNRLIQEGKLKSVKIRRRRLVPKHSIREYVKQLELEEEV